MMKSQTSYGWWFDSHHSPKRSPWLQSAIAEFDQRTQAMLKLLEEDADSFGQRAEMYYNKRPQLITMIEDFWRTHCSLLARYDELKTDYGTRDCLHPFSFWTKKQADYKSASSTELIYHAYSETSCDIEGRNRDPELEDSAESEVEDPEEVLDDNEITEEGVLSRIDNVEMRNLREEIESLREENKIQRKQLLQKDEEKKEVIRQLSLAVNLLKDDNARLRKSAGNGLKSTNKKNTFGSGPFNGAFLRKLFHVAL